MNSLRVEGQKTVSIEMVQQFDWGVPDWVVIPGGNLGNVSALGAGFADDEGAGDHPEAAAHLRRAGGGGEPALPRLQGGLGQLRAAHGASRRSRRRSRSATRSASRRRSGRCRRSTASSSTRRRRSWPTPPPRADRTGLFNCPHTGVALAALEKLVARGEIRASDRVVVVSTANGLKFTDFKVRYHDGELPEVPKPRARQPSGAAPQRLHHRPRRRPRCARQLAK